MGDDPEPALKRVDIGPRAQTDITAISRFTLQRWGKEQRSSYRALLTSTIRGLGRFPQSGRPRDDLFVGCRMFSVGEHVVFYRVTERAVIVERILHVRQDPTGEVS